MFNSSKPFEFTNEANAIIWNNQFDDISYLK